MKPIIFTAEEEGGGYIARAMGHSFFTEAATIEDLKTAIAIECHFETAMPFIIQ
jgi:hypothetical protein